MKFKREIRIAFSYIEEHKWLAVSTVLVLIAATIFEGLGVGMIMPIIQSLIGGSVNNVFISYARSVFSAMHIEYSFTNLMVFFGLLMLLRFGMTALQQYLARVISATVTSELRERAFENLMRLPLSYYYQRKVGDIIATVYTSSNNAGGIVELLVQLFVGLLFILVYISINLMISASLTIIVCLLAAVSYFLVIKKFKIGFIQGKEEKDRTDKISSFLLDKLAGIKTVKSFNNEELHIRDFRELALAFKWIQIKIQNNRILADIYLEPFVTILIIGLMIFSIKILYVPVASLLTLFYIFSHIIPKIKAVNNNYLNIMNYLPHFSIVQNIIGKENKTYLSEGTRKIKTLNHGIEFRGVFFRYPGTKEYAVKNVSMFMERNKTTALVSASGAGKTTIVDLVLRHHDPEKGVIEVDGIDLREIKRHDWHKLVSMVEQDAYLFNDTIYNNITYGKLNANRDEVVCAARLANAHDFIQELPDEYNTLVGERGMKLSGGQKQRISLARALIKDPQILILDEATSSLDSESEKMIQESIKKISNKKTIVVIAHRLSTIVNADKIIVIENGQIVEEGSHEELFKSGSFYKKYYHLQYQTPCDRVVIKPASKDLSLIS